MTQTARPQSETEVSVRLVDTVRKRMDDLVIAWARNAHTRQLRYILELGDKERGKRCGCVCISCGHALMAVNAATDEWEVRPHFRHFKGTLQQSCAVLSARAALLSSLREGDWIVLPRQRRSVGVTGISGTVYEAWIEAPAQKVHIQKVHFEDQLTAMIELADGRRLRVLVTGTTQAAPDASGGVVPSIVIAVDSPELAEMAPDELRQRLIPLIEQADWCGHWPDPVLDAAKLQEAREKAAEALDLDDQEQDLPRDLRRESLLHREVKAILESASSLMLPGWVDPLDDDDQFDPYEVPPRRVGVRGAVLEHRLGRIIPDVIARLGDGSELLIEVTVTNRITDERLDRIRQVNLPTLEIDFSRMGGVVSRERLRKLVLDDLMGKDWLHRPDWGRSRHEDFSVDGDVDIDTSAKAEEVQRAIRAHTAQEWRLRYLAAVRHCAAVRIEERPLDDPEHKERMRLALADIEVAADALHLYGYPAAVDSRLFDYGHSILERVLSVKLGTGVGYRYKTAWEVINTMMTDVSDESKSWHSLYLLAIKAYDPHMKPAQERSYLKWRNKVVASIRQGEATYRRDPRYDALFALLFPEMAEGLAKSFGKRGISHATEQIPASARPIGLPARMFREEMAQRWVWSTGSAERVRHAELRASRLRLNGHTIGPMGLAYHLVRSRHAFAPWMYVSTLCEKGGWYFEDVMIYLYKHDYISLTNER